MTQCADKDNFRSGLAIQRLTTKEPADEMIEVAIASMKPVLPENAEDAKW